jgi:hypothetical protein|tara:strand:+ start:2359 stop:2616 length:258 start_codon:yes stop_codon:yes gene_type:complete
MTKRELRELIRSTIKEYTGTGSFRNPVKGGQNPRASQRSRFDTDEDELEFYNDQNAGEGGQGHHTSGMEPVQKSGNPNRTPHTRF